MEPLINRLKAILEERFPGSKVELELIGEGTKERVFGTISWAGFVDLDQTDRQARVWTVIDTSFRPEEVRRIFGVLTFIPEELVGVEEDF